MPKPPIFPRREADLNNYFNTAVSYVTEAGNAARLGIVAGTIALLNNALIDWQMCYTTSTDPNQRTKTITAQKDMCAGRLTDVLRGVYADIPESKLTLADRTTLNLQKRSAPTPAPVPDTRPIFQIDTSNRLRHVIRVSDEAVPGGRSKPARVRGAQIWVCVEDAVPPTLSDYKYLGTDTDSRFIADFSSTQGGVNAWYIGRWENNRGETGPWSDTVMATIGA